jgi:hypothetical protein
VFLDRGEIVERGTHAELLAKRGAYHRLHSMQFGGDGGGGDGEDDVTSAAASRMVPSAG